MRLADATKDASTSLWNALLTFSGILIAASSVLIALGKINKCLALVLTLLSIISSILVIYNLISYEAMYNELLKKITKGLKNITSPETIRRDKESKQRYCRTYFAIIFLMIEAVLICEFIYFSK